MEKLIMTIDLDAFFASCEELRHPEIKGTPMVVANDIQGRGIITTSNYAAREYGIKSGMPIFKAKKLLPGIVVINPDHDFYQKKANQVFSIIKTYSEIIEIASIDECYIDVTKMTMKLKPLVIASMIANKIYSETGLYVSIGISTNIFLSKMASSMDKPKGITTLYTHEIKNKLWPLKIGKLHMVGSSTSAKFINKGILTIGDLALVKTDNKLYMTLKKELGINLDKYISSANGIGRDEIFSSYTDLKSVSKEKTLGISLIDLDSLKDALRSLFEINIYRLTSRKMVCSSVKIIIKKDKTFNQISSTKKLKNKSDDKEILWSTSAELIEEIFKSGMSIKQVGISFQGLAPKEKIYIQNNLFEEKNNMDRIQVIADDTSDKLNLDIFKGTTMKDNRKYKKEKELLDNDSIKFKVWEK